jgi:hypothetical protein
MVQGPLVMQRGANTAQISENSYEDIARQDNKVQLLWLERGSKLGDDNGYLNRLAGGLWSNL